MSPREGQWGAGSGGEKGFLPRRSPRKAAENAEKISDGEGTGYFVGSYPFSAIDHVQLAMPPGGEDRARAFYGKLLGMREVPKPAELAKRGGCWFECGPVQIHLGVEVNFRPARKAHPALRCFDYDSLVSRLKASRVEVTEDTGIPGVRRGHITDPFGNRIELISA